MREIYRTRTIWPPVEFGHIVFIISPYVSVFAEENDYVLEFGNAEESYEIDRNKSKKRAIRYANNFINNMDRKSRDDARIVLALYEGGSYLPEL